MSCIILPPLPLLPPHPNLPPSPHPHPDTLLSLNHHTGTVRDCTFVPHSEDSLLISGGAGCFSCFVTDCSTGQAIVKMAGHQGQTTTLTPRIIERRVFVRRVFRFYMASRTRGSTSGRNIRTPITHMPTPDPSWITCISYLYVIIYHIYIYR